VGRVGADQYYCWDCCVEFAVTKNGLQVFELDDEGELVALDADGSAPQA